MTIACSTSVRCGSSLERALTDIAAAGFRAIDLLVIDGWVHLNTRDLADDFDSAVAPLDALLAQHKLRPVALNTGVGPQLHHRSQEVNIQRAREIDALIRLMRHLNVAVAAIQPRNADNERPWDDVLLDASATVREQINTGTSAGLTFVLELHVNSPFETMEQARRLLDVMPDLALVYDPTHFVMQGIDIRETGWLMDRARHVHLRDAAPGKIQAPFGEGTVDFDWVLGELEQRGYQGHFSIEYLENKDFDVIDSAQRLHETIARRFPE